ncbi:hypothetical protein K505DRAFT_396698 [Melanomma pulvis-pyrius CBS 109.77]|uniref:Uncharacterized protein n=1 Tax=Melanomma pulvis-pyrius CBS 109.77 TaxID=1314802 RepID=A0A6A6WTM9_9PLEO|nr:hypothetical protein K505DRAFT_396698 [Melanomma pulvis-pyrius CBS 109.77]
MAPKTGGNSKKTRVYISGFHGQHAIEVGVAYWYRGHYIYGPARNPIEPLQFATKKGIMIAGTVIETAPPYVRSDQTCIMEYEVGALRKAMMKESQDKEMKAEENDAKIVEEKEETSGNGVPSILPPSIERITDQFFTPNDRGHFLAASAPGSNHASPHNSRPASPISLTLSRNRLRPIASNLLDKESMAIHMQPRSRPSSPGPSRLQARPLSRPQSAKSTYSIELGSMSLLCNASAKARINSDFDSTNGSDSGEKSTLVRDDRSWINAFYRNGKATTDSSNIASKANSGRPRKASIALNEAYNQQKLLNGCKEAEKQSDRYVFGSTDSKICIGTLENGQVDRVTKCAIHGEECDGKTVTNLHQTEKARRAMGFKDLYPVVESEGRVMVDWNRIVCEEKKRMENMSLY